jgi:hypothetical protein
MMADPTIMVAMASFGVAATGIASAALLRGWTGWLEIKRLELTGGKRRLGAVSPARGDLAELKARVRKLEAIASGIDT